MEKQFLNTKDIQNIMGICYNKALAFIKYSGIPYIKINRTYLVSKANFDKHMSSDSTIIVDFSDRI